ncbi:MAG: hypothetical protein K0R75_2083 [Paenibacillaceae bacterium]|nr:hypothetical protein [Paenibacillaceae bacterium]
MYAEWTHGFVHLIRYGSAFLFLLVFVPRLIFHQARGDLAERIVGRFQMMTLLLIGLGYALVAIKLFELLAIIPAFILIALAQGAWRNRRNKRSMKQEEANDEQQVRSYIPKVYDYLERKYNPWPEIKASVMERISEATVAWRSRLRHLPTMVEAAIVLFVFAAAAYIRFADALTHAAPAMSDSYVTLAWIKYVNQRILFHDGIYPQGFHIFMGYLVKFSFLDPLYILKYTGPLDSMLTMAGMYFAVSRWAGSRTAGTVAAAVFCFLSGIIGWSDVERQAATNAQEFAFVFVFPTLYFIHRWLRDRVRWALSAGVAGMVAAGLVHTLAYAYCGGDSCRLRCRRRADRARRDRFRSRCCRGRARDVEVRRLRLAAFTACYMALAIGLACLLPWVKLPRLLAAIEARRSTEAPVADVHTEIALLDRIARCKFFVIRNNCLKKSLLFYYYLLQTGVTGVAIHLGVDKRGGKLAGHCWLTLNGQVFQDTEQFVSNYKVIYTSGE